MNESTTATVTQLEHYRKENENLWEENKRKSRLVDKFWEQQNVTIEKK